MTDACVNVTQQRMAQEVLTTLKEHPDAWTRVDTILEYSQSQQTKYYALQILENVIKTRWKVLPRTQCEGSASTAVSSSLWHSFLLLCHSANNLQCCDQINRSVSNISLFVVILHCSTIEVDEITHNIFINLGKEGALSIFKNCTGG